MSPKKPAPKVARVNPSRSLPPSVKGVKNQMKRLEMARMESARPPVSRAENNAMKRVNRLTMEEVKRFNKVATPKGQQFFKKSGGQAALSKVVKLSKADSKAAFSAVKASNARLKAAGSKIAAKSAAVKAEAKASKAAPMTKKDIGNAKLDKLIGPRRSFGGGSMGGGGGGAGGGMGPGRGLSPKPRP